MSFGAALFAADMGSRPEGADESNDQDKTETMLMERTYFNLARDTREVLVSELHDAAARDDVELLETALKKGSKVRRCCRRCVGERLCMRKSTCAARLAAACFRSAPQKRLTTGKVVPSNLRTSVCFECPF